MFEQPLQIRTRLFISALQSRPLIKPIALLLIQRFKNVFITIAINKSIYYLLIYADPTSTVNALY